MMWPLTQIALQNEQVILTPEIAFVATTVSGGRLARRERLTYHPSAAGGMGEEHVVKQDEEDRRIPRAGGEVGLPSCGTLGYLSGCSFSARICSNPRQCSHRADSFPGSKLETRS